MASRPTLFKERFGEILVKKKLITNEQLEEALLYQAETGARVGQAIIELGFADEDQITKALHVHLKIPYVKDLSDINTNKIVLDGINISLMRENLFIPVDIEEKNGNKTVAVVCSDIYNDVIYNACIEAYNGIQPSYSLAKSSDIIRWIEDYEREIYVEKGRHLIRGDIATTHIYNLNSRDSSSPTVQQVNLILIEAQRRGASDIHISPMMSGVEIHYRINGDLIYITTYDHAVGSAIVARLKNMAGKDSIERMKPQDGGFQGIIDDFGIDMRLAAVPAVFGEKITIRLLDPRNVTKMTLETIGLNEHNKKRMLQLARSPNGILLVTGATGAGKSTTMYMLLNMLLKEGNKSIITIEDPVEYKMDGFVQSQVNEKFGYTYSEALKSFLRHDPDVILLGEIRDRLTAAIATEAATTGQFIISTLHTKDSIAAFTRLVQLGVENFQVADGLLGVTGQVLVKTLCPFCSESYSLHIDSKELAETYKQGKIGVHLDLKRPKIRNKEPSIGCEKCNFTGYAGRIPLQEIMINTPKIQEAILKNDILSARKTALSEGLIPIYDDGIEKVLAGITTIEEVRKEAKNNEY